MKKLTLSILFILIAFNVQIINASEKTSCIKALSNAHGLYNEVTFDISKCDDVDKLEWSFINYVISTDELAIYSRERGDDGYGLRSFRRFKSDINKIKKLLEKNHSDNDGSIPFDDKEIKKIENFYKLSSTNSEVSLFKFTDEYMGGTGITMYAVFFNEDKTQMTTIKKDIYED